MTTALVDVSQALYRFYDAAGRLLYIGITADLGGRWGHHNRHKPWWRDVANATVEHYPSREAVLAAEVAAIIAEHPLHNVKHNQSKRRRPTSDLFQIKAPTGSREWRFSNRDSGYTRTEPLWLYWEVDGDPLSDEYYTDEIDAVELWNEWRRRYPPNPDEFFGPTTKRIHWYVDGWSTLESAPGQDGRGLEYPPIEHFLTWFTWPVDARTGEPVQWMSLPVVDKLWQTAGDKGVTTKGGFIQEATGWKPAPYQPYLDVTQLEQLSRI